MITVLDYDAGNIKSVENALNFLGEEVKITRDREEILSADGVILPGVGAFGDAMEKLHQYGLVDVIHEVVDRQIPFLGICLGLQLMFESSEETPGVEGLHLLDGKIRRIPAAEELKIPLSLRRRRNMEHGFMHLWKKITFLPVSSIPRKVPGWE